MKKLFVFLILFLFTYGCAGIGPAPTSDVDLMSKAEKSAADTKVTGLTELAATPEGTDILMIVDDPGGTPVSKKITVTNLLASKQAADADLTTWAGITPSSNGGSLVSAADYAAMRGLLDLEAGTDFNAYDADIADLADGSLTGTKVGFADTDNLWTATNVQAAIEEMNDSINAGAPNGAGAKVNWSQLLGVPAGFADGTDDGAGATQLVDIVTTSPLRVNAGDNVNDALPGSDADITFSVNAATDSASGVVELSTDAESVTGTSDTVVVTPGTLTARLAAPGAIGGTTAGAGTFTTLSAGATGFAVDADGDTTVKSITVSASASPGVTGYDSDLLGADETAGFLGWQGVTLTDGAEDTDFLLQIMQAGTLTTVLFFDESDDQWETTKAFSGGAGTFTTLNATTINLPSSDASPSTTAGQIRHDSTVTGLTTGAIAWYDGDEVRYLVDLDVLPSDDAYVVAYNATDDKFYMKADATGAGGDQLVDIVATAPLLVNGTTNVNDALPGSDADITFSISAAAASDVNTGTSTATVVTPDALAGSNLGTKEVAWTIKNSDAETAVADGKQAFAVPASMNGMNLVDVTASVADLNSAASGATTVVIRRVRGATAADMTSTGVTVAYNEYTASDETVDTSNDDLATGDKLYVDINAVTSAVHKGLSVTALFRLP